VGSVAGRGGKTRIKLVEGVLGQTAVKWEQVMRSWVPGGGTDTIFDIVASDLGRWEIGFQFSYLVPGGWALVALGAPHGRSVGAAPGSWGPSHQPSPEQGSRGGTEAAPGTGHIPGRAVGSWSPALLRHR